MSDYSFREDQKVSIWRDDGEKCFYCRIPISYSELQVDHIVPEKVFIGKLEELRLVLPAGFEVKSITNWVTCHQGCDIRKSAYVFRRLRLCSTLAWPPSVNQQSRRTLKISRFRKTTADC